MKYAVIIEKGPNSYGAQVPDLPGCIAVAETRDEVCRLIQEAIELYVEALEEEGLSAPEPQSYELWRYRHRTPLCLQPGGSGVPGEARWDHLGVLLSCVYHFLVSNIKRIGKLGAPKWEDETANVGTA